MSYVLTLTPGAPFKETTHASDTSAHSLLSAGTVKRRHPREASINSLLSLDSQLSPTASRSEDSTAGSALVSPSWNLLAAPSKSTSSSQRSFSACDSRASPQPSFFSALSACAEKDNTRHNGPKPHFGSVDTAVTCGRSEDAYRYQSSESPERLERVDSTTMSTTEAVAFPFPITQQPLEFEVSFGQQDLEQDSLASLEPTAFRRWMSTLRRRRQKTRPRIVTPRKHRWVLDDFDERKALSPRLQQHRHRKSSSQSSSLGFVSAVRSATVTIASTSIAPLSKRTLRFRRGQQHSSILSGSETRPSVDSERSILDEAAKQRSRKRYEKVEELLRTEESYIADVKALSNVRDVGYRALVEC